MTDTTPLAGDVFQQRHENGHSLQTLTQPESIGTFYGVAGCVQAIAETELDSHGDTFVHTTISTELVEADPGLYQVRWVGFDRALTGTSMLSEYPSLLSQTQSGFWTPPNRTARPMRLRDRSQAPALIEAARALVGQEVEYSNLGLIVFFLVSAARVLPACQLREDLLNLAYAQDSFIFVPTMGTCSSVLGEAVKRATGTTVRVTEPAPPSAARIDETGWVLAVIADALTGRFDVAHADAEGQSELATSLATSILDALDGTDSATLDLAETAEHTEAVVRQLADLDADDTHASDMAAYIVFLENSLLMVTGSDRRDSIKTGRKIRASQSGLDASRTYLASPAMLRRALLADLFYEP